MLETIDAIRNDRVAQKILKMLASKWIPIKIIIPKLEVDRHTVYRRFNALEKHKLIEKSRQKHKSSRYRVFGYSLTEAGRLLIEEKINFPVVEIKYALHSFEHNYLTRAKLFTYPSSKADMFKSKIVYNCLQRGLYHMIMELTRDENVVLNDCRLIFDFHFESIAEIDIYEFYRDCLSPSLSSYVEDRTFSSQKSLAIRINETPKISLELIKHTRFIVDYYKIEIGKENFELITDALDMASRETKEAKKSWANTVSGLIINGHLLLLASIYRNIGELPEPEKEFEQWYTAMKDLPKLKEIYHPLLEGLRQKIGKAG